MTDEQKAAYINSQCIGALIRMESMKVKNKTNEIVGLAPCYVESDFLCLESEFVIGYNDVLGIFHP